MKGISKKQNSKMNKNSLNNTLNKLLEVDNFFSIKNSDQRNNNNKDNYNMAFYIEENGKSYVFDEKNKTKEYPFNLKKESSSLGIYLENNGLSTGNCNGGIDTRDFIGTSDHYMGGNLLDFHGSICNNGSGLYGKNTEYILLNNIPYMISELIKYGDSIYEKNIEGDKLLVKIKGIDNEELLKNKEKLKSNLEKSLNNRIQKLNLDLGGKNLNQIVKEYIDIYSNFEYKEALYINGQKVGEGTNIIMLKNLDGINGVDFNLYNIYNTKTNQKDLYMNGNLIKEHSTLTNFAPPPIGDFIEISNEQINEFNEGNFFIIDLIDNKKFYYMSGEKTLLEFNNGLKGVYFDHIEGKGLKKDTLNGMYLKDNDDNVFYNGNLVDKYETFSNKFNDKNIFLGQNKEDINLNRATIIKNGVIIGYINLLDLFNNEDFLLRKNKVTIFNKNSIIGSSINDKSYNENVGNENTYIKNISLDSFKFKDEDNTHNYLLDENGNEYLIGYNQNGKQVIFKNYNIIKEIDDDKKATNFYIENSKVKVKIIEK